MRNYRKFEQKARHRQVRAFFLAVAIFTSIFAALIYGEDLSELMPDFMKEMMGDAPKGEPQA